MDFEREIEKNATIDLTPKSSHRIHYEAQVKVIIRQIGGLDSIRQKLGLSQRKICQLLMVDPSAWTRWTRKGNSTPPHIYRALQWYMLLQEKIPGLTPQYFVGKDPEILHQTALRKIEQESDKINHRIQSQIHTQNQDLQIQNQVLLKRIESLETSIKVQRSVFQRTAFSFVALIVSIFIYMIYFHSK